MKAKIEKFWQLFNERNFEEAKELLHKEFAASWETTSEVFENRDDFIEVNKDYPGNWRAEVRKLELTENGAVSVTYLYFMDADNDESYYATTFYQFKDELIYKMEEYWATCEKAPSWRVKYQSS